VMNPSKFARRLKTDAGLKSYELIRAALISLSLASYFMISKKSLDMSHSIFYGSLSSGKGM